MEEEVGEEGVEEEIEEMGGMSKIFYCFFPVDPDTEGMVGQAFSFSLSATVQGDTLSTFIFISAYGPRYWNFEEISVKKIEILCISDVVKNRRYKEDFRVVVQEV